MCSEQYCPLNCDVILILKLIQTSKELVSTLNLECFHFLAAKYMSYMCLHFVWGCMCRIYTHFYYKKGIIRVFCEINDGK